MPWTSQPRFDSSCFPTHLLVQELGQSGLVAAMGDPAREGFGDELVKADGLTSQLRDLVTYRPSAALTSYRNIRVYSSRSL